MFFCVMAPRYICAFNWPVLVILQLTMLMFHNSSGSTTKPDAERKADDFFGLLNKLLYNKKTAKILKNFPGKPFKVEKS